MARLLLSMAILASGIYYYVLSRYPDSVLVPDPPLQSDLHYSDSRAFRHRGYIITPLAAYSLNALVLSKQEYLDGKEAELSPIDLALGWGPMSNRRIVSKFDVVQNARFYYYNWKGSPPIPASEIATHSANVHIIPSTAEIENQIRSLSTGDVVALDGYLVSAEADDGWKWKSSLTRMDSGAGACELLWVDGLSVH